MPKTKQEILWAGEFGNKYTSRNSNDKGIASRLYLFSQILSRTRNVQSMLELGANMGQNLIAIHRLMPDVSISAVEINHSAVESLKQLDFVTDVFEISIHEFIAHQQYDFVFTRGVLIHLNQERLNEVYRLLYACSSRYICLIEYYNPKPLKVEYRGYDDVLFKRDFAGEIMEVFPDLELVDYGFIYKKDSNFPQDDVTWFLLRKTTGEYHIHK